MRKRALEGMKVIDLGHALAGPFCGALLADYGADVIKVEPPGGDDARNVGPFPAPGADSGALFQFCNRNKRGIVLDLKSEKDRDVLLRLIDDADILIENFRAGVMERLGLSYETLAERNPRLVYTSIRGFGDPRNGVTQYTNWPAVDVVAQAMGGIMGITGPDSRSPTHVGAVPGDTVPGLYAAFATMVAAWEAKVSGQGQYVDVGMVDALLALNEPVTTSYSLTKKVPLPSGSQLRNIVPFGRVEAKDGWVVIAVPPGRSWKVFCERIGRPELADDPRYANEAGRVERADEVYALVEEYTRHRTMEELSGILGGSIPYAPVFTADRISNDPYFKTREMLVEIDWPEGERKAVVPGIPAKMARTPGAIRTRAPKLGEHTAEVLRELDSRSPV